MTQEELDLARFALVIAGLQLAVDEAIAKCVGNLEHAAVIAAQGSAMNTLAIKIGDGTIIGSDASRA